MRIHQFKMQFNAEEDRLQFQLNTEDQKEFRFFMTRRYVGLLWPVVQKLLAEDLRRRSGAPPETAGEMLAFEREKTVQQTNFKQIYQEEATEFPLGEAPLLLSRIQVKKAGGMQLLCLLPSDGRGIELPATPAFLHPFCRLLKELSGKAQWNLQLMEPEPSAMGVPASRMVH
ncbi:MAG: hypothetical protein CSB33_04170 [Desulfobacterales bacterium]|nr:MAG: hypothetical protein CSB33_04170 [Desulfobacterales bacterium]